MSPTTSLDERVKEITKDWHQQLHTKKSGWDEDPANFENWLHTTLLQTSLQEERERIIKEYGDYNDGCECCSDTDLRTELLKEATKPQD